MKSLTNAQRLIILVAMYFAILYSTNSSRHWLQLILICIINTFLITYNFILYKKNKKEAQHMLIVTILGILFSIFIIFFNLQVL